MHFSNETMRGGCGGRKRWRGAGGGGVSGGGAGGGGVWRQWRRQAGAAGAHLGGWWRGLALGADAPMQSSLATPRCSRLGVNEAAVW